MSPESPLFTERELQILTAICDTLVPALDVTPDPGGLYHRRTSDLHVPEAIARAIETTLDPDSQKLLKLTLDLLDQPFVNVALGRSAGSFLDMSVGERTALLRDWEESRFNLRRKAFQAFKRLTLFFFYSILDDQNSNLNWPAIGYPGLPPIDTPTEQTIRPLQLTGDALLQADVVIVGSGAGGGVVAGELSAAGLDVVVLEKGGYYADFTGRELASTERLFENRGLVATADLGITILAGSTLGGGTTVNWCASLRTPEPVLHEWERVYGVTGFTGRAYQQALDSVSKRINVNEDECAANFQNAALERGSKALGYTVKNIPRNVKGCGDCGFCTYGCRLGAKQGTLRTYLQDAYNRGAKIVVQAEVERVLIESGKAVGVVATAQSTDGKPVHLTVKARGVVLAAGTIHTPAILLRSGLTNAHIGRNVHLHPTAPTFGIYDEPVCGWGGVLMSRYVPEFNNLYHHYGVTLETAPIHPGIAALSIGWADGYQHKNMMRQLANLANIIVITRDRDSGRVTLDRRGKPVLRYSLSQFDGAHLMRGVVEALRIHRAAGAREISGPHTPPTVYTEADFDEYLRLVQALAFQPNRAALFSAHQMSSCRMGGSPAHGAIDPTGEAFEVDNLFVADGSALPTASGVNPMLTIMGVSYLTAQHVKARLNR
jgi:choline dehydrogenase-like flavoprotein